MDIDTLNAIKAEEKAVEKWYSRQLNIIRQVHSPTVRMERYKALMQTEKSSDDYLLGNIF